MGTFPPISFASLPPVPFPRLSPFLLFFPRTEQRTRRVEDRSLAPSPRLSYRDRIDGRSRRPFSCRDRTDGRRQAGATSPPHSPMTPATTAAPAAPTVKTEWWASRRPSSALAHVLMRPLRPPLHLQKMNLNVESASIDDPLSTVPTSPLKMSLNVKSASIVDPLLTVPTSPLKLEYFDIESDDLNERPVKKTKYSDAKDSDTLSSHPSPSVQESPLDIGWSFPRWRQCFHRRRMGPC
ncbi:hypothetical protein BS78_K037700 [Paspalum vaginatum]|uniref:Uncharacterized protein n=1 Tax=Paspalum vaginatum TaxID=158149 RepID=A0A9W8CG49_9POAL|nr:hypothetical protein BS78_K037700 [Paspalum vaginatum]KAJ1256392.1 hypothetical protein BS78_K037700 [Paspalum vaginatum]KAJ1256393.1 hypothetical protein BS78_K037700 [Paspalum vaginatum]